MGGAGPSATYPDPSKKKGKEKEEVNYGPRVNDIFREYVKKGKKITEDDTKPNSVKRREMDDLDIKVDHKLSKISSSYSNEKALEKRMYYLNEFDKIEKADIDDMEKRESNLDLWENITKKIAIEIK